jgi:hypothetical protein
MKVKGSKVQQRSSPKQVFILFWVLLLKTGLQFSVEILFVDLRKQSQLELICKRMVLAGLNDVLEKGEDSLYSSARGRDQHHKPDSFLNTISFPWWTTHHSQMLQDTSALSTFHLSTSAVLCCFVVL